MVVSIGQKAREKGIRSEDLLTREVGRILYRAVRENISTMREGETLVLDFTGIRVMDPSCIDELIVRLLTDARESRGQWYVKLCGLSETTELTVDLVLKSYSSYTWKKMIVMTEKICHNNSFFLGAFDELERDILEFLRVNRTASVEEIATFAGLSPEEAAKVTAGLVEAAAVRLERDGSFSVV